VHRLASEEKTAAVGDVVVGADALPAVASSSAVVVGTKRQILLTMVHRRRWAAVGSPLGQLLQRRHQSHRTDWKEGVLGSTDWKEGVLGSPWCAVSRNARRESSRCVGWIWKQSAVRPFRKEAALFCLVPMLVAAL
jgi:hypothetical protein